MKLSLTRGDAQVDINRFELGPARDAFLEPWRIHRNAVSGMEGVLTQTAQRMEDDLRSFYQSQISIYMELAEHRDAAFAIVREQFTSFLDGSKTKMKSRRRGRRRVTIKPTMEAPTLRGKMVARTKEKASKSAKLLFVRNRKC